MFKFKRLCSVQNLQMWFVIILDYKMHHLDDKESQFRNEVQRLERICRDQLCTQHGILIKPLVVTQMQGPRFFMPRYSSLDGCPFSRSHTMVYGGGVPRKSALKTTSKSFASVTFRPTSVAIHPIPSRLELDPEERHCCNPLHRIKLLHVATQFMKRVHGADAADEHAWVKFFEQNPWIDDLFEDEHLSRERILTEYLTQMRLIVIRFKYRD